MDDNYIYPTVGQLDEESTFRCIRTFVLRYSTIGAARTTAWVKIRSLGFLRYAGIHWHTH